MAIEIERKFLVQGDAWRAAPAVFYSQGYLNRDKARTVRVRIAGDEAFLTIKGQSIGASRVEFEYAIPLADARELLALCEQPLIEKYRRKIAYGGFIWEVDEFLGENLGLVVAEIEIPAEDTLFTRPAWVSEEVTSDARYFNSNLAKHPFSQW
ncbi:CYTH domain-containing protein [Cellvibrio sp. NN19]|uniref:CYTH domain-containing protein n=1 Tax=Cellvibrio chitinivorans TaxID=3102792 RepID=UPI002B405118|nr:CYTH domain-containing protein [Cellvibrio sp. NN19]